ncbi:Capsular polysaccharide biosynthesis protein [Quadrisphaera granulorum]|uniref:Capsular polysaccharide biosynthesis protein n=1 Tax=Quadrisphaera granulorum TaxID=317664 RepID=A0A316AE19_9ACTN|nr:polysaccharide biosynthesis tyrosine autokinase [Quadrisphaera granulorum]PWJ55124.1 capsular polysaccharide biosynthesis protein [Quadrisphaera granulorum]SZE95633.1 Capsular polysaccharide biosynthesis protein [Quadrisphaera granulorum]
MTLSDYLRMLRRGWLIIVATTLVGLGLANLATAFMTPVYGATAQVVVTTTNDGTATGLAAGNAFATERTGTYAQLATSTAVLQNAAAALGQDVETLRSNASANAITGTAILNVVGSGDSGTLAADRANAVADALIDQARTIDGGGSSPLRLDVVTPAVAAATPDTPRPKNNLLIGAVVGLALGVGALVVAQALDTRIRSLADLPRGTRLATTTSLPAPGSRLGRGGRPGAATDLRLESFRHLRANLQFSAQVGGAIAIAGVTSASDTAGVARQLSGVLGEIGLNVVVVDTDLRPVQTRRRRPQDTGANAPGVADVLGGSATLDEVLAPGASEGVWTIGAGHVKESSAQMLSTQSMRQLIDSLVDRFDYVLLTCPPLVERSESSVVAALSHSTLLVVESGATTRADLLYALELLAGVGVENASLALDRVRSIDLGRTKPVQVAQPLPQLGE